jgi:exodeoxyribonuclease X
MNKPPIAIVFDTETTGREASTIIEAAWLAMNPDFTNQGPEGAYCERFLPPATVEMEWGAIATHHILPHELLGCRPSRDFSLPLNLEYMVGHNIDFDWEVAGKPEVKRICTLALSRWLWPDMDGHSQSALYYWFNSHNDESLEDARTTLRGAHSAVVDVGICHFILETEILEIRDRGIACDTFEQLWELSETARIPTKMPFGKHKGEFINALPPSYKSWLLKQEDMDPYVRIAVQGGKKMVGGLSIS